MLMPSIFRENLLDDFFGSPFRTRSYETSVNEMMKTDVKENGQGYEMIMNLPGIKTIQASSNSEKNEKDSEGRYIRRERYSGSCSRSFYIGEAVRQEDIKARFEDGTLKLLIPKKEERPAAEEKRYIAIEG